MIGKAFSNINNILSSTADLSNTLRECGTARDIRKIKEIEEKKLSDSERQIAFLELLAEMPKEDRDKILDIIKNNKNSKTGIESNERQPDAQVSTHADWNTPENAMKILPTLVAMVIILMPILIGIANSGSSEPNIILRPPTIEIINGTPYNDDYDITTAQNEIFIKTGLNAANNEKTKVTVNDIKATKCTDGSCDFRISFDDLGGKNACKSYTVIAENEEGKDSLSVHIRNSDGSNACYYDEPLKTTPKVKPYTYEHLSAQGMLDTRTYIYVSDFSTVDSDYKDRIKATIKEVIANDNKIDLKSAWIHIFIDKNCYEQEQATRDCKFTDDNIVAEYQSYDYSEMNKKFNTSYANKYELTFYPASKSGKKSTEIWRP